MDPATAMLGAIGIALNEQNALNAQGTAQDNLAFQRSQGNRQFELSTAGKVDANGNKTVYDPVTNTWKSILTPMQQAIQDASQSEQLKTVTSDAQRKRQLAERQQQYSEDAGTPYNTAVQKYIYQQPDSEAAINDQIGTLMTQAKQASGKENQATLTREALRLGRGADIPSLIKATNDSLGASTPSTMLAARQQALQEHQSRVQSHDQQFLPEISAFKQIIDQGGGGAAARFSDLSPAVMNAEQNSSNAMLTALNNANTGINTASKNLQAAQGAKIDFGPMIKAMSAGKTKADGTTDGMPDYSNISDYLQNLPQNLGMGGDYLS